MYTHAQLVFGLSIDVTEFWKLSLLYKKSEKRMNNLKKYFVNFVNSLTN